jgi:cold shock CspA family protein
MNNPVVVEASVYTGVCKWYNEDKGYGFLKIENNPSDVFVHAKQLRKSGIEEGLNDGDRLSFKLMIGLKGQYAINLRRVTDACQS